MKNTTTLLLILSIFLMQACDKKKDSSVTAEKSASALPIAKSTNPGSNTELGLVKDDVTQNDESDSEAGVEDGDLDEQLSKNNQGSATEKSGENQIKILTLNTWLNTMSSNREERSTAICEELKKASTQKDGWDIVMLQAVWKTKNRNQFKDCGYANIDIFQDSSAGFNNSGLITLSKLKIIKTLQFKLPTIKNMAERFIDGERKRYAQLSQIQLNATQYIWVINLEMALNDGSLKTKDDDEDRRLQLNALADWIQKEVPEGRTIVGGSFHISPKGAGYTPLWDDIDKHLKGFKQNVFPSKITCTDCGIELNSYGAEENGKVDHLFARELNGVASAVVLTKKITVKTKEVNLSKFFGFEEVFQY